MNPPPGKVYLVGAGPGDPGLLTVRGRELLERADAVVYDNLVNDALLAHAPNAEHVHVGKSPERHMLTQEDINRVLVELAGRHSLVVRLKGGDPFVFGRGGEEAEVLAEAGIAFEIVPGVTAGVAVPAYAGIPVTRRGVSSSVTFLTGHKDTATGEFETSLDKMHLTGTLVIYMGLRNLRQLTARLIELGRSADTPAAAVEWGTFNRQRTITATLETLHRECEQEEFATPVLTIIGEVVSLRETISWFENRPLYGRRVVVTQTRERSADLVHRLHDLGADVFEFPTLEIETPASEPPPEVTGHDWIILTSVNGVDFLFEALDRQDLDARALHGTRICAISARTAEALEQRGIRVDAVPETYEPEALLSALEESGGSIGGQRVLLPRADIGRSAIPRALRDQGAEVTELQAYTTVVPADTEALADELVAYRPEYILFGSASAIRNFHAVVGVERIAGLDGATLVAIGPVAAAAAADLGMNVAVTPTVHRVPNLVEALVDWDHSHRGS